MRQNSLLADIYEATDYRVEANGTDMPGDHCVGFLVTELGNIDAPIAYIPGEGHSRATVLRWAKAIAANPNVTREYPNALLAGESIYLRDRTRAGQRMPRWVYGLKLRPLGARQALVPMYSTPYDIDLATQLAEQHVARRQAPAMLSRIA